MEKSTPTSCERGKAMSWSRSLDKKPMRYTP
jgi:hypothetical protein